MCEAEERAEGTEKHSLTEATPDTRWDFTWICVYFDQETLLPMVNEHLLLEYYIYNKCLNTQNKSGIFDPEYSVSASQFNDLLHL